MHSKILQRNTEYQNKVEQLLARLAPLDEALLNRPAANGGWSAIQTVHHLILSEELSLGYVRKKLSFPAQLENAGLKTRLRAASSSSVDAAAAGQTEGSGHRVLPSSLARSGRGWPAG